MASVHSLAEEKRRPRESGFGSLSAGLIERGKVPPAFLPDRQDAPANDTSQATGVVPLLEVEREWLIPSAEAAAQAAAERTRSRESSFGTLSGGFIERGGALSRQILSQAQIELLLAPEPFEYETLSNLAEPVPEAADAEAAEAESGEGPVEAAAPVAPAPKPDLLPVPLEPSKPIPTPQDFYRAALAETEIAPPAKPRRRWFRSLAIWTLSLLVAGAASWLLWQMPELPVAAPAPAAPMPRIELGLPELPPAPPLPDMSVAPPPAAEASPAPAIEAADELAPVEPETATPVLRRRPGVVEEPPVPEGAPPPPELSAASPPVAAPMPAAEPKKKKSKSAASASPSRSGI